MPVNKRQLAVDALVAALVKIRKKDGYETDAGLHVYLWRAVDVPPRDLPALIVRDIDTPTQESFGEHHHAMEVQVEGLCLAASEQVPADVVARRLIADVVKAIGADLTLGGTAADVRPQTESMLAEQESRKLLGCRLTFTVLFTTETWNPYA